MLGISCIQMIINRTKPADPKRLGSKPVDVATCRLTGRTCVPEGCQDRKGQRQTESGSVVPRTSPQASFSRERGSTGSAVIIRKGSSLPKEQ
jgi:hypothetical protein